MYLKLLFTLVLSTFYLTRKFLEERIEQNKIGYINISIPKILPPPLVAK